MQIAPEDVQEYRFTVAQGAKPGSKVSFEGGLRTLKIGRAVENDIVLSDPSVSRQHLKVEIRADGCFVCDLGSSSGSEKMGFRLGRELEPLVSGDELRVGDTILRFEVVAKRGALKKAAAAKAGAEAAGKGQAAAAKTPSGSPIDQALARVGLKTRRARIYAGIGLVVLLGLMLWPQAPGLPPQAKATLPIDYNRKVGFGVGDDTHLDGAVFAVPADAEGVVVHLELVATAGGVVRTGRGPVGEIEPSKKWGHYRVTVIPRAIADAKGPRLVIDNLGYSAKQGDIDPATAKSWGARNMWVARVAEASSSPGQLIEDMRALGELALRREETLGGRHAAVEVGRRVLVGLMKLGGRGSVLVPVASAEQAKAVDVPAIVAAAREQVAADRAAEAIATIIPAIAQLESDLQREHRKQMNQLALAKKRKNANNEITTLAQLTKLIPDRTDPRRRLIGGDIAALKGMQKKLYEETLVRLGEQRRRR